MRIFLTGLKSVLGTIMHANIRDILDVYINVYAETDKQGVFWTSL